MRGFNEKEFCAVDSLVLSQFSYLFFDGVIPGIENFNSGVRIKDTFLAERLPLMFDKVRAPQDNKRLIVALAGSPRFRDVKMNYYVSEIDIDIEKQFAAMCFTLDRSNAYVAFRGTDATFIGWKEDFNMAFMHEVPAQARAVEYLNKVSRKLPRNLIVGGHSKGGNLAVYSAAMCKPAVQKRISAIYSHDGPGFQKSLLESAQYINIKDRVHKTVPQSSIIGMLLEHQEDYTVVKSNRLGIMQHDPFSWEVCEEGFCQLDQVTGSAKRLDRALHDWLSGLTDADRERFVDSLYQIIKATNATTIYDFQNIGLKDIKSIISLTGNLDADTKKFLNDAIKSLIVLSIKNIRQ